ncbi:MAG: von Willebrand factor type like domain [Deltaproteobacteria bacterium]|nr:von Willebrand factor type like domain [Deltaproteobacteria bacterium]
MSTVISSKAYDVEPLSIPDVLAERPVLVFGKWRGNAGGTVTISGVAGGGRYSESIKVENYKASNDNAALKYLWARYRITLLSDYNKLRNDDKRVKEITELGLNYNLLTAYTSFVAVDNEVRNVNGKWTTVKQPLPLPEGVSDYAVGSPGPYPAAPVAQRGWGVGLAMKSRTSEDKQAVREVEVSEKKDEAQKISFTDVVSEKGLTSDEISDGLKAQTGDIKKCLAGLKTTGMIKLRFIINPDGTVKKAEIISGAIANSGFRQCVTDRVKKLVFPATKNKKEVTVTLSIVIS